MCDIQRDLHGVDQGCGFAPLLPIRCRSMTRLVCTRTLSLKVLLVDFLFVSEANDINMKVICMHFAYYVMTYLPQKILFLNLKHLDKYNTAKEMHAVIYRPHLQ